LLQLHLKSNLSARDRLRLSQRGADQQIDVLVDYPGRRMRPPIFAIAEQTGVHL
jgi:hypothetical protein